MKTVWLHCHHPSNGVEDNAVTYWLSDTIPTVKTRTVWARTTQAALEDTLFYLSHHARDIHQEVRIKVAHKSVVTKIRQCAIATVGVHLMHERLDDFSGSDASVPEHIARRATLTKLR